MERLGNIYIYISIRFISLSLMQFFDEVIISVQSWKGGDGVATGRREKGVPFGGPSWWDGGRGWSVIFVADPQEYTLMHLRYKRVWKAKAWTQWQSKDKYGAAAKDVHIPVPLGTLVKDKETWHVLAHLVDPEDTYVVVVWWRWGVGNMHFVTSTNQYPTFALSGEPWHKKNVQVELQLLWDVALVGTPSVGKSTLINALSRVQAKTAAYEFTTLVPNLGIVERKGKSFCMVDVPGLVSGAHAWKWLGNVFLRHILKARVWIIMLDAAKDLQGIQERWLLLDEICAYVEQKYRWQQTNDWVIEHVHHRLAIQSMGIVYEAYTMREWKEQVLMKKIIITVVNKYDLLDEELREEYRSYVLEHMHAYLDDFSDVAWLREDLVDSLFTLSAMQRDRMDACLDRCMTLVKDDTMTSYQDMDMYEAFQSTHEQYCEKMEDDVLDFLVQDGYIEECEGKKQPCAWDIYHERLAYLSYVLPRWNDEAELWFWRTLEQEWIIKRLRSSWVRVGDIFHIRSPYQGTDDRRIRRE